jgi:hypothetical protein
VILEVLPELPGLHLNTLNKLPEVAADGPGSVVDAGAVDQRAGPTAVDQPSTSFRRSRSASISHQGTALGQAPTAVQSDGRTQRAADAQFELPGHRAGVPAIYRAAVDLAALVVVY